MTNKRVFISGISGFLGSQIALELISSGNYEIIASKRGTSDLFRCEKFIDKIKWVDVESIMWQDEIIKWKPEIIIHLAWSGVSSTDRNNWDIQLSNLDLTLEILKIAKESESNKVLGFGSQAEYGNFSGIIDENFPLEPNNAYAVSKILSSELLKDFCSINNIDWYWFRLFSFFGELESDNWFIPTLIKKIKNGENLEMTLGEQKYAYMDVKDLSNIIRLILKMNISSGIYNLSSKKAISLKDLTLNTIKIIDSEYSNVYFGKIPYRDNQSMHIQGSVSKLEKALGFSIIENDFNTSLERVINFFLKNN